MLTTLPFALRYGFVEQCFLDRRGILGVGLHFRDDASVDDLRDQQRTTLLPLHGGQPKTPRAIVPQDEIHSQSRATQRRLRQPRTDAARPAQTGK